MVRPIEALIVGDDPRVRQDIELALESQNFRLSRAASAEEGLSLVKRRRFDVVLLALDLPEMPGLEILAQIRELPQPPEVVVLTGRPEPASGVEALAAGAFDYLSKPLESFKLAATLKNAAIKNRLSRENAALKHTVSKHRGDSGGQVVANSEGMKRALGVVDRVAPSDASVMIRGETGAGKVLMAKLLHNQSARSQEPHLHISCGALDDTLLESELFGHEKGAFPGATIAKPGLFEVADGGTVFLDEIAETSAAMQAKLLQALDRGELRRVGGTTLIRFDVRIVSATNKDLDQEIAEGRFRRDLYFRLNVVTLALPPLRERRDDVPGLVEMYLDRHRLPGQAIKTVSPAAMTRLCDYSWPGNVRELANVVENLVLMASGDVIEVADLPAGLTGGEPAAAGEEPPPETLAEIQKRHIARVLRYTGGKKAPAARLLKIDVKTLYSKIRTYGIEV